MYTAGWEGIANTIGSFTQMFVDNVPNIPTIEFQMHSNFAIVNWTLQY
jgi:hypothetical protein